MYEAFYSLNEKPFSILPDPDFLLWTETHSLAFAMLEYGLLNQAGFTVITGEIGCGKTTLIRHLLRHLGKNVSVGLITNTALDRGHLLEWIMMSFNQPLEKASYTNLYAELQKFLIDEYSKNRTCVLIVDEAQNLSADILEELRMLSNINTDKSQLLQIVLVGQPQLREMLLSPELFQFAQRISSDFHLGPLNPDEVIAYIGHRLHLSGAESTIFSRNACLMIADVSLGIPRTINILCDTALTYGYAHGARKITTYLVQKVIADKRKYGLFFLPQRAETERRSVVEPDRRAEIVAHQELEPRTETFFRVSEARFDLDAPVRANIRPPLLGTAPMAPRYRPTKSGLVKSK